MSSNEGKLIAVNLNTPIVYKGTRLEVDLRCDIFVEECLVIEIKSAEGILPIHIA